jgi:CRISPR-associated protein Csb1
MEVLSFEVLQQAVGGDAAAVTRVTRLLPLGEKAYPATYEGGQYATEPRKVKGEGETRTVETVLLDSVQSQANRMELALLRAIEEGRLRMPLVEVDFASGEQDPILLEVGRVTALEAPHRIFDAIFRDSTFQGVPFRESTIGQELTAARSANASALLRYCPTALVFGYWDSTGPRGGLGAKLQRALVSEIVGYDVEKGKRPTSRIDPLQIENNVDIYRRQRGGWTLDPNLAEIRDGDPVRTKPSEMNHGNVTPALTHEDKQTRKPVANHGGVTLAYAVQHSVLSLAAIRRLRFPVAGRLNPDADLAGRTLVAAVGLAAICLLDRDGYDLRSRCLLDGQPGTFELVGGGKAHPFQLDEANAVGLVHRAAAEARVRGLEWPEERVTLTASRDLRELVVRSRQRSMAADS